MAAKTSSKHKKEMYNAYKTENRFATNRKRKLLKLQKKFPNNEQITAALNNIHYRRKTPKTKMFSKTKISTLSLQKEARTNTEVKITSPTTLKGMYSLGARVHSKGVPFSWPNI